MAPLRPLPDRNTAPSKSILKTNRPVTKSVQSEPLFANSKKDKRRIKHAQLISKVTKTDTTKQRRRRPSKKLVTTLDALADALPDDVDDSTSANEAAGTLPADQINVIRRKSMKSRPGALKRKQKLDNSERDRFARNLAQMAVPASSTASASSADKLRALRGFISQTLEKRTDVAEAKG